MDTFLPFSAQFADGGISTIFTYFTVLFGWIPPDLLLFIGIVMVIVIALALKRIIIS